MRSPHCARWCFIISLSVLCLNLIPAQADASSKHGTAKEAIEMVKRVIAMYKTAGAQKTFKAIKNKKTFRDRDLYAFIFHIEGVMVAHGALTALDGKNLILLQDGDGKFLVKEFIELMKVKQTGWVDYKWPNFATGRLDQKSTYLEKINKDYFVGVGIHQGN